MKKLLFALCLLPVALFAQDDNQVYSDPATVQQMPKFNGDLPTYVSSHLSIPANHFQGKQGVVYVNFVVEKDGSLTGAKAIKHLDPALDSAAVVCVNGMPKWVPGVKDGKNVRVMYNLPIKFVMPIIETQSVNPTTPPPVR